MLAKATPGPLHHASYPHVKELDDPNGQAVVQCWTAHDAALIAALRNDAAVMLDVIEAAQKYMDADPFSDEENAAAVLLLHEALARLTARAKKGG